MALMQLLFGKNKKKGFCYPGDEGGSDTISLQLDVITSETPEYTATPTKTQVEDGSDVTDHVALDPEKLSFEAVVSNTPIGWDKLIESDRFTDRAQAAHEFILELRNNRQPFDFVGSLGVYRNMIITKYSPTQDSKTGNALQFSMTIEQIRIVSTSIVASATAKYSDGVKHTAPKTENQGMKATNKITENDNRTLLNRINDATRVLPGLAR